MNEALACRGQDIYIVGGANSAGQAAIYFSKFARRVTLLVRADSLSKSMSQYLVDQISLIPNIAVQTHVNVTEVRGKEHLEMICITNAETGEEELVPAFALFIFIGAEPHTEWLSGTLARDKHGFILTGPDVSNSRQDWSLNRPPSLLESSIPGVVVAGDVRHGSIKRVASGVGEGSIAVQLVHQYLREVK